MAKSNREHMVKIGKLGLQNSKIAMRKLREDRISNYNLSPKLCKECSSPIEYDKKRNDFCSKTCSAKFNNRGVCRHGTPSRRCISCGKQILSEDIKKKKCLDCDRPEKIKRKLEEFGINLLLNPISKVNTKLLRDYLIYTRGHKCEHCLNTQWNGKPIPFDVHHIDGDYLNNNLNNLKILCKNCHAQTDTYGGKNKGNAKRKRYFRLRDIGI